MRLRPGRIRPATPLWLLLLVITAASAWLGGTQTVRDERYVGAAIVALAFVKIRFVMLDFMEIRRAPLAMRLACETWVIVLCATLISIDLL